MSGEFDKGEKIIDSFISIYELENNYEKLGYLYNEKGVLFSFKNQEGKAIEYYIIENH